jgi:uncharacterized protein YjbI with pentapeptide repeats
VGAPKDRPESSIPAQAFDTLPAGPIEPFDPSWDARPRVQRSELTIAPIADLPKGVLEELLRASFNDSDAKALQRFLTNRWERGVDLAFADLRRRDLSDIEEELQRCNLEGADLSGSRLIHTDFSYSSMRGANLSGITSLETSFTGCDLREADFSRANLTFALFGGAILAEASFVDATLVNARMPGANLRGAVLIRADLTEADLRGADMTGADLDGACLHKANLAGAVMPNGQRYVDPDDESGHIVGRYRTT